MKKIEYKAPEMEIITLKTRMNVLLETSGGNAEFDEPGGL